MPLSVLVGQSSLASPTGPNQDFAGAVTPDEPMLGSKGVALAIADGVGKGSVGGALAEASVRAFLGGWYSSPETWSATRRLSTLLVEANATARRDHPKAACTLTAAVIHGQNLHVAHVGDSRAWLVRKDQVRQLTTDHVWDNPDMRSVLHRAVGLDEDISPQFVQVELAKGDVVVLATDGFHKSFDPVGLSWELKRGELLDDSADRMVSEARTRGGDDDATVLIARVEALPCPNEIGFLAVQEDIPPVDHPMEGLDLDGFRLQKRLGGGRLSSVWLADDREGERRVVIKIPEARSVQDTATREEFLREEWVGKRISHPGVVPVLSLRPGRRTRLYYAMPWTDGTSLRRILSRSGALDAFSATRLGLEIAAALRELHRQGVLHRDIKPDNILRDGSGCHKLTDLGVARIEAFSSDSGAEPGTPSYMAPEMFLGQAANESTEVFALGVTLYECLTKKLPYGEIEPFTRPKFGRAVPLSRWNPEIPPWLESVVLRAIEPDPALRFQVLSELEFHLEHCERVSNALPAKAIDPEKHLRYWKATAILAIVVAALEAVAILAKP